MSPDSHRSRYDTSGNPEAEYVDAAQLVLVNKLRITDATQLQLAEEMANARAYERLLQEVRMDTPLTCELIRYIHAMIFGGLYEWAGRWRTVWISKPGTTWPPPDFLDQSMVSFETEVLRMHTPASVKNDVDFCRAVSTIQGEFLVIHPFREGNARTIKLATNLLSIQTGRPLLRYDQSKSGSAAYIEAAKAAFRRDYSLLATIIQEALIRATSST